jgi:surface carbohydrate biosynthesis protein (TIGR04326 family)
VERAARRYSPRVSLSFLEHFPYSRAYYEGMRRSEKKVSCWAMQHAAYNHEKTFCYLEPGIEFRGSPDDNAVPHPDKIFVMGRLGQQLFRECGYEDNQILLAGSTRYDYIKMPMPNIIRKSPSIEKVILLVCTLSAETELPMIEAVSLAAQNIEGLHLRIRNHPFMRVDKQRCYKRLNLSIEISNVSLEEDLTNCDLIVFSYSTIAEEAFLRGIPVWQWLPQGFNGSALSEVMDIPRFGSVSSLQTALNDFYENPDRYRPTKEMIQKVAEQIFYPADGGATARIAEECLNYLKEKEQKELT